MDFVHFQVSYIPGMPSLPFSPTGPTGRYSTCYIVVVEILEILVWVLSAVHCLSSTSSRYPNTHFLSALTTIALLNKDAAYIYLAFYLNTKKGCTSQARCSCYLGPGGRATMQLNLNTHIWNYFRELLDSNSRSAMWESQDNLCAMSSPI